MVAVADTLNSVYISEQSRQYLVSFSWRACSCIILQHNLVAEEGYRYCLYSSKLSCSNGMPMNTLHDNSMNIILLTKQFPCITKSTQSKSDNNRDATL